MLILIAILGICDSSLLELTFVKQCFAHFGGNSVLAVLDVS